MNAAQALAVGPTTADVVREYLAHRWYLVPIPRGTKGPTTPGWNLPENAIYKPEHAARCTGNVGLLHVLSRTCALDVDDLPRALDWCSARGVDLVALLAADDAVQISSGRQNRAKILYRVPDYADPRELITRRIADGAFELRCASRDGASVQDVLPPSIHPDTGQPYTWAGAGDWRNLPVLPDALLNLWRAINAEGARPRAAVTTTTTDSAIPQGARNATLTSLAGTMRRRGMSPDAIEAALIAENVRCNPPLPDDEVRRIAASVARYEPERPARCEWPEPHPLIERIPSEPYPLDALPNTIRAAVAEVQEFTKAPLPLVASSALSALSLVSQTLADVERAEGLAGPISTFALAVADSGERKTTVDGYFTRPIRDYEAKCAVESQSALAKFHADEAAWNAEREGILHAIRSNAKGGKSTELKKGELRDLESRKPQRPRVPLLLRQDDTPESLAWTLHADWPSAGVISAEAGIVFGGHAMGRDSIMRNLAQLNVLWDGGTLRIGRRTKESFSVSGARLTVGLQLQAATLRAFFDHDDGLARGMGFLARFLIAWPDSTMGTRFFSEPPATWPALTKFDARLTALLESTPPPNDAGELTPTMLRLSPDAKRTWIAFHDEIERELASGKELYDVRDVASKAAENAARVAALFHVFGHGAAGMIGAESFERASRVVAWHLHEARRFFGELALPPEVADAQRLDAWLIEHCRQNNTGTLSTRTVLRLGPGSLRSKAKLTQAIEGLEELGRVRLIRDGRQRLIELNPALRGGCHGTA